MVFSLRTCRTFLVILFLNLTILSAWAIAGQTQSQSSQKPSTPTTPPEVETQKIEAPSNTTPPPVTFSNDSGSMTAADLKALLTKVRFAEYRINDLLADVRPQRWKLATTTLDSFNESLKALHNQIAALEQWRAQFEQRTDSLYLGFQTYSAINSVLPRLDGVTRSVAEHETAGYAAQFSQVGGQLFDMQETIGRYVSSLLKNQDQVLLGYQSSIATCQQNLSVAMRGQTERAKTMRNSQPTRPVRRSSHQKSGKSGGAGNPSKTENKPGDKMSTQSTKSDQKKN